MNIILLGAGGFIGTNLVIELVKNPGNNITVVDKSEAFLSTIKGLMLPNIRYIVSSLTMGEDYEKIVDGQDVVYHLVSTTVPSTANQHIAEELKGNVILTACLLDACVRRGVKRVVFLSSGGAVYGKESKCPLDESTPTNPITSYGVQKITIEKLLYLYEYIYGLDYRIIRLTNPYGPYQRPNGVLGAVTTFTYKALKNEEIVVYGDGSVVRDFIYIDDAIRGIVKIAEGDNPYRTFNLGCGYGTSIKQLLSLIKNVLGTNMIVKYSESRPVDVPVNYLDITRFESAYGPLHPLKLSDGIRKTADFLKAHYNM